MSRIFRTPLAVALASAVALAACQPAQEAAPSDTASVAPRPKAMHRESARVAAHDATPTAGRSPRSAYRPAKSTVRARSINSSAV